MARTQKYTEELLLEAVVKYAEAESGKIKATELAAWAAVNISGLEGVRDYHFMRPVRERNLQTGVVTVRHKLCTVRMEEINRARSLTSQISRNTLLARSRKQGKRWGGLLQRMKACPARMRHSGRRIKASARGWSSLQKTSDVCRIHRGGLRSRSPT